MVVQDHHVVHTIHLFTLIEPGSVRIFVSRHVDFDESFINEFDTTLELHNVSTKGTPLLGQRSLFEVASLMQDVMRIASSHIVFLFYFHMNVLYMNMLSCFMYIIG